VSDVPRLLALARAIGHCVPVARVAAVGFSNGGLMANALACRAARRVRAMVLASAGYRNLGPCHPAQPVSVLAFHGTRDAIVPYAGFRRFMATLARRHGCAPRPASTRGRFAARFAWGGCRDSRVELVRVERDTHGWPALEGANRRIIDFVG
jgi:polyhydroxybutyrate depolymerase